MNSNWYAIHTYTAKEQSVSDLLTQAFIPTLAPLIQEKKPDGRNKTKKVLCPLFPRYIFANFNLEDHYRLITYTRGVYDIVRCGQDPCAIPEELIDEIQARTAEFGFVKYDEPKVNAPFDVDEELIVTLGAMTGYRGLFKGWRPGKERVQILFHTITNQPLVEIELSRVSRAAVEYAFA